MKEAGTACNDKEAKIGARRGRKKRRIDEVQRDEGADVQRRRGGTRENQRKERGMKTTMRRRRQTKVKAADDERGNDDEIRIKRGTE